MKKSFLWVVILMALAGIGRSETVVWWDNFDTNGASRWSASGSGVWQVGTANSFSGSYSANTYGYSVSKDVRFVCNNYNGSSTLLVPSADQFPRLRFEHFFNLANALCYVEISTDNGSTWTQISQTYEYNIVPNGGGVWSRPYIDLSAYAGQNVKFALHFTSGGTGNGSGWFVDDIGVVTGTPAVNDPEGFESGEGDWAVTTGTWQIGLPTSGPGSAHSGLNCAATLLAGNYPNNVNSMLVSPIFLVPTVSNPTFSFWHWYSFNNALGYVAISTDGNTWTQLSPTYQNASSGGWLNVSLSLSNYIGQAVQIAFEFDSGGTGADPGWYIDDITFPNDPAVLSISAADSYMYPNGTTNQFIVTRSGGLNGFLTVNLAAGGTAVAGTDYTALPSSVTFQPNMFSTNLNVILKTNATFTAAKTIELGISTNAYYVSGLYTNAVITVLPLSSSTNSVIAPAGRYWRGSGSDPTYWSQVIPQDGETGTIYSNINGNAYSLYGITSWNSSDYYHFNATNLLSRTNSTYRIPYNNPIVAFGERVGGTPLYVNQNYSFGVYAGDPMPIQAPFVITVYNRSDFSVAGFINFNPPNIANSNSWTSYATNGYQVVASTNYLSNGTTGTTNTFGLTTILSDSPNLNWGTASGTLETRGAYVLTHIATAQATNYYYIVQAYGWLASVGAPMAQTSTGSYAPSMLYSLEFEQRPNWRSTFLDQPHFDGSPLPPFYAGKTVAEIMTNTPPVTNVVNFTPSAATNLDDSPELRRHPVLDSFVASLGNDPIALANYVINNIDLTDPMDYSDNGNVAEQAIDPTGVTRGALGTFMEKQGSPIDQCALLVYLLRQAGVPAVYEFPPRGGLKLLDTRLSRILKFQVNGASDEAGQLYTTNTMITVNYPWVAAYIGTNWVHIFPWLKDYEIVEGLNLFDEMPTNYSNAYGWVHDYVFGNTNLLSLAQDGDNTPRVIFPKFLQQTLLQNHPGISVDDIGVDVYNRQHYYARWQDFPTPTWVTNVSYSLESLTSSAITNISPTLTNIFDTLNVEIYSVNNETNAIWTGDMRLVDLHDREFFISQTSPNTNTVQLSLILMPFRTNITTQAAFRNDTNLLSKEVLTMNLGAYDDQLDVRFRYHRHRALSAVYPIDPNIAFFGMNGIEQVQLDRPLRKGDQAAICMSYGKVTPTMLNLHANDIWQMQSQLQANHSLTNSVSPDVYEGATMYLAGMSYYERQGEFDQLNQNLNKMDTLSSFAIGLSIISPARDSYGNLTNNQVYPVLPTVDMFYYNMAFAGNGTVQPDSGQTPQMSAQNYSLLAVTDRSAEEHQIIDTYYQQTNAVSTVRLLQQAQSSGAGIVTVNLYNINQVGTNIYQGQELALWDLNLWSEVVNAFSDSSTYGYTTAYVTPGPMTNSAYSGMAALVLGWGNWEALISPQSLNGGFGQPFQLLTAISPDNTINFNLSANNDNSYTLATTTPANGTTLAPTTSPDFDFQSTYNGIENSTYSISYYDSQWNSSVNTVYNLPATGTQNQNYASAFQTTSQNGLLGEIWGSISQVGTSIADPVHPITGEFYIDETDLQLPGPIPLAVRRNYSSQNFADNQFGTGWKFSIMPYLGVAPGGTNIYAADMDGAVLAYVQTTTNANVWIPSLAANPQINNNTTAGAGGLVNRLRDRLTRTGGSTTNYTLFGADGSIRAFQVMSFTNGALIQSRPYLQRWTDNRGNYYTFSYGTNASQSNFGEVTRIQCSNGNYLGFDYDIYSHIIDAYSGDGRRLTYEYDEYGDLVTVTLPDATTRSYQYQHLTQAVTNGSAYYSTHLITEEDKPDGRVLQNFYDSQRRVTNQLSTAGADLNPIRTASFIYANNFNVTNSYTNAIAGYTLIIDGNSHTNRYDYTNSLITKITDPSGQTFQQTWYPDNATAPGYPRSVATRTDKRGLVTQLFYDSNGNVTNTITTGDLTGVGITSQTSTNTALYNTNNLPVQMTDASGNGFTTVYDPVFNFLPQQVVRYAGTTPVSTNFMLYGNATNVVVNGNITQTNLAFGLLTREIRAFGSPDAATNDMAYNGNGFLTQTIKYTGTTDPNVTNTFFYNERGNPVVQMDSLGAYVFKDYDANNNVIESENFDENNNPLAWNFNYYDDNGELNWIDGPRYNPEDYIFYDYDGDGRVTTEIHWLSEANPNGTGVTAPSGYNLYAQTFYEYDPMGNLTLKVDPRGAMTTNQWDALCRISKTTHLDVDGVTVLSTEGFGYEPGGLVQFYTNALGGVATTLYTTTGKPEFQSNPDGSTNAWRYYLDGRIKREVQPNGAYWQTTYDDVNRITTRTFYSPSNTVEVVTSTQLDRRGNVIQTVDAGGNVFTAAYDGLDRSKVAAGPAIVTVSSYDDIHFNIVYTTNVLQQISTNFYDAAGRAMTNVNALGEQTVSLMDALGRTTSKLIYNASGSLARERYFTYSDDHNSVTVTDGSGATAFSHTTYTDTEGHTVLSIAYPAIGALDYTWQAYDLAGNLDYEEHDSSPGGMWTFASFGHDGLNRLTFETNRDDAVTAYVYDSMGDITSRTIPGGLQWNALYSSAGQIQQDWLVGTGGVGTRTNTYSYYSTGSPFVGLLDTMTDGRGLVSAYTYDDWLRQSSVSRADFNYNYVNTSWGYEARGYVTNITEQYAANDSGNNPKVVSRTYDPYGQLNSETITVNGATFSSAGQTWDPAGRRTGLAINEATYNFASRADGALIYAGNQTGSGVYSYDTAGMLTNRAVGSRTTAIATRDGEGRPTSIVTAINGTTELTETLGWNSDGTLATHTLDRPDFTDSRIYSYASLSRRLTQEQINLNAGTSWTNNFAYDTGTASGPGVLTQMGVPGTASANWNGGVSPFSRVNTETNTSVVWPAYGRVNGQSTLSAFLDGQPLSLTTNDTVDPSHPIRWYTTMELTPGVHQLKVAAAHPSGFYTAWATNWFTNSIGSQSVAISRDGGGYITQRTWHDPNGTMVHQQSLFFDGKGRPADIFDIDGSQSGFYLHSEYDGLDRRLYTTCTVFTNGQDPNLAPVVISQFYDPMAEFLELGVSTDDQDVWKLYGPDQNGQYGGLNGTGGFEGYSAYLNLFTPVISDFRGNILAEVSNNATSWSPARPTGYGAVPGYRPAALGHGADLSLASAWRGRWADITGYYQIGKRMYDPVAGMWLSYDSTWNENDPNYLTFCGGDPINGFDSDGRMAKGFYAGYNDSSVPANASAAFMNGYMGGGVTSGFGEGWDEGAAIVDNALTLGQINSLNTYANSLQGGVYDWSRGLADVGVGSLAVATGGALLEASPTLYVAAVNASANPLTYVVASGVASGAYTYSSGGSPEDVAVSTVAGAGIAYSANPFSVSGMGTEPIPDASPEVPPAEVSSPQPVPNITTEDDATVPPGMMAQQVQQQQAQASPNAAAQQAVQGEYVNPLNNQSVVTDDTLAADHIYPQVAIKQLPGYDQLTPSQQSQVLNNPANFQGLPKTFNSSKGGQMPGQWTTYKGQPLDPGYIQRNQQLQTQLQQQLQQQINDLLQENSQNE